jgi:hypothetical protein
MLSMPECNCDYSQLFDEVKLGTTGLGHLKTSFEEL